MLGVTNSQQSLRHEAARDHDEPIPEPFPKDRLFFLGSGHDRTHQDRRAVNQQQSADRRLVFGGVLAVKSLQPRDEPPNRTMPPKIPTTMIATSRIGPRTGDPVRGISPPGVSPATATRRAAAEPVTEQPALSDDDPCTVRRRNPRARASLLARLGGQGTDQRGKQLSSISGRRDITDIMVTDYIG